MPVVIGQVVSMTGGNPGGLDNARGARLAVDEINAAGGLLRGQPVELVAADDRTSPAHAVTAFRELTRHDPSAVVGTSYSNASLAIAPEADQAGMSYVSTGAADSQVQPVRAHTFMTPPTASAVAEQLLRYFQAHGMSKVALAYDSHSMFARTGHQAHVSLAHQYGVEFVDIAEFRVDTREFGPLLDQARASDADGLMAWATGPPAVELVRQRPRDLPLIMSHGNSDQRFLQATGPAANGVVAAASLGIVARFLPASNVRDAALTMTARFAELHGYFPSQYAIDSYTAVNLIASAITAAATDDPQQVRDALENLTAVTPQGEYRYTPTNHHGLTAAQVAVTEVDKGIFVPTDWSRAELAETLT